MSALAFHEKAGRCQPVFLWLLGTSSSPIRSGRDSLHAELFFVATLPSALWCERLIARCKLGVLDSAGAATCYCDLPLDLADEVLGQGNDAVTGTRLVTRNLHISRLNYATDGSVARLLGRSGT